MSIGVASSSEKAYIHTGGKSMSDADKSVVEYTKGNIFYINVINNLSVDCDCVSSPEKICMLDIGIVSSLDPVAIDKACTDLIYNSKDQGSSHMIEKI